MRPADRRRPLAVGHARGVGLIEVLVTTLLVSLGLLGLASLQLTSLGRSTSSTLRTEALLQSYDLLDRMRANRAQAIGGLYDLPFEASASGSTLAAGDLGDWKAALDDTLPDGDGQVQVDAQVVTISVRWRDGAASDGMVSLRSRL